MSDKLLKEKLKETIFCSELEISDLTLLQVDDSATMRPPSEIFHTTSV